MDFDHFAPARDYYYLTALLLGAGIGCFLNRFRRNATRRFRNWSITIGLIFFSGAFAALAAAIIYSTGRILLETSLYPYLGILAAVLILAFRFPKAAGFPIILISGVFIIWISYGYLRFPAVNDSGRLRITRESNGLIHVIPVVNSAGARNSGVNSGEYPLPVFSFQAEGDNQVLEFRAFCFSFSRVLPLVGGVDRGDIAEIRCGYDVLYTDQRFGNKLFPGLYLGADTMLAAWHFFSIQEIPAKLELRRLRSGEGLTVYFNINDLGTDLVFL